MKMLGWKQVKLRKLLFFKSANKWKLEILSYGLLISHVCDLVFEVCFS